MVSKQIRFPKELFEKLQAAQQQLQEENRAATVTFSDTVRYVVSLGLEVLENPSAHDAK